MSNIARVKFELKQALLLQPDEEKVLILNSVVAECNKQMALIHSKNTDQFVEVIKDDGSNECVVDGSGIANNEVSGVNQEERAGPEGEMDNSV